MTARTWIRRLFAREPRTTRQDPVRSRPCLERLETRLAPTVNVLNNFSGLKSDAPPDACGAAGPSSYVETVNSSVAIYDKSNNGGSLTTYASYDLPTFYALASSFKYTLASGTGLADSTCCYDEPIGRFIVASLVVTRGSNGQATAPSWLDLAVSTSNNPRSFLDWAVFQIPTSQSGTLWSDYPGNIGYNANALVVTFNLSDNTHSEVLALSQNDLKQASFTSAVLSNYRQFQLNGWSYRPVTMHGSVASDPMWLVQGGGGSRNPSNPSFQGGGDTINLVRFDDILSASATSATYTRGVNAFDAVLTPQNPDGTGIIDSSDPQSPDTRILKAAENNNTIVACQIVGVGSTEDDSRWYKLNVSNINNPTLVDQGNVGFGANTYTVYPGIDVNAAGDVAMSVIRSGTDSAGDYMSVYVAGRTAADAPGLMYTRLAKAGDSNYTGGREGDFSGISLDPNDGTFWTANEYVSGGSGSTQITHFGIADTVQASVDGNGVLQVAGSNIADNIALQPNPSNSSQTQVLNNGAVVGNFANSSFSSINVAAGGGNDTITFRGGSAPGFLVVPVTVDGGSGSNRLILDDSASTTTNVYTVTSNTVGRSGFGGVTYTNVSNLELDDGTSSDAVNVKSTSAVLQIFANGRDAVYVGSNGSDLGGNVQGIKGAVVVSGPGAATLVVDDSGDTLGRTATLSDSVAGGFLGGLAPAAISWKPTLSGINGVTGLRAFGGSGGNTFNVTGTSNFLTRTYLNTGNGNDRVNVYGTTGALTIDNPFGQDSVRILSPVRNPFSPSHTLQGIRGDVNVSGFGATSLVVDDSRDATGRTVTLSDGALTGLAPATISWTATSSAGGGVTGLSVSGGFGGNTFVVTNTSNFANGTSLSTGAGNDRVSVSGTTGGLTVSNPGGQDSVFITTFFHNVQSINGSVNVSGAGATLLVVNDSGDTVGRTATLSVGTITGLAPASAPITWTPTSRATGGVTGFNVHGGSGGNTFTVTNTSKFSSSPTTLITGGDNDTVNVYATTGPLNVENDGGPASVYVGSKGSTPGGNVRGINGNVFVNGTGATSLTVDDGGDTAARTATLSDGALTGLTPASATITWTPASSASGGVTGLSVYGGYGGNSGNTFNVTNTSNFANGTSLSTGTGNDTVNVYATTGALNVVNPGNFDSVYVGLGSVQGINGDVNVSGGGGTGLLVDDSADPTGRTATLSDGALTGLAPADISWAPSGRSNSGGVNGLTINGGSGGNTFNVTNTSTLFFPTALSTGGGNDTVNVEGTTGALNVVNPGGRDFVYVGSNGSALGGDVRGISGGVNVSGRGTTILTVDDSGDATGRTATLSDGALTWLAPAPATITWTPTSKATGGVVTLSVYGGSGGNTFNVTNVSNFYASAALITGTGNDTVNVKGTTGALYVVNPAGQDLVYVGSNGSAPGGNVQGIKGNVFVYGAGATSLLVDDRGDAARQKATLSDAAFAGGRSGTITGLAPADISWIPTGSATGGVTDLGVFGGSGGNTFDVTNTSNFYYWTTLRTGTGNDTVNVKGTTGALHVFNPGGQDSVYVGSNGSALRGNVQGINGAVIVGGLGDGPTTLVVDDGGDTTGRTATLSSGDLTGLAPAAISWTATSSATGGVTGLSVHGGSGGNTFNVTNTSKFYTSTDLHTGTGNDTVNVYATTGALNVVNPGGQDSVYIDVRGHVQGIGGGVNVSGAGATSLTVDDGSDRRTLSALVTNSAVTGLGNSAAITYGRGVTALTVIGSQGASTYTVQSTRAGTATTVNGGAANDTFQVGDATHALSAFQGALTLNGGGGNNTLDYSSFVGHVTVDLPLGLATAVAGGVSNIQNVTGGQGDDLIVGDSNANVLVGGTGRNIIIGGGGGDTIRGGGGDNILIAGTTAYDTDPALTALNALFAEWTSGDSLSTRVHLITQGVGPNGRYYLNPTATPNTKPATVFRGSDADKVYDGGGPSLFFVINQNQINDGTGTSNSFDVVETFP